MAVKLPSEILYKIVSNVELSSSRQHDLWAMALVSRSFYFTAISSLYQKPAIWGRNFQLFVRTICPSINAHVRKTSFSTMVKELDMSRLVHDSCKSLTARILSRLKEGLEVLVAPRASFANLACLEKLSFRCRDDAAKQRLDLRWPLGLKSLIVTGLISDDSLQHLFSLPRSLTSLTLYQSLPFHPDQMKKLLEVIGSSLISFHVDSAQPFSHPECLIDFLPYLPNLRTLHVCHAAFSFLDIRSPQVQQSYDAANPHPLECLEIDSSREDEVFYGLGIDCDSVWDTITEGYLGRVRKVRYQFRRDGFLPKHLKCALKELDDLLRALAREDGEKGTIREENAGVDIIWV
ncbi:MAG: hypothetical protein Q9219_001049 [cf. Caloplaca sp. 3 TL-2023]